MFSNYRIGWTRSFWDTFLFIKMNICNTLPFAIGFYKTPVLFRNLEKISQSFDLKKPDEYQLD